MVCLSRLCPFKVVSILGYGILGYVIAPYRVSALLYQPGNSCLTDQEYVAIIVALELANQWFGDLVIMDWWTDLWLNEGLASYNEYIGTNFVSPETKYHHRQIYLGVPPACSVL